MASHRSCGRKGGRRLTVGALLIESSLDLQPSQFPPLVHQISVTRARNRTHSTPSPIVWPNSCRLDGPLATVKIAAKTKAGSGEKHRGTGKFVRNTTIPNGAIPPRSPGSPLPRFPSHQCVSQSERTIPRSRQGTPPGRGLRFRRHLSLRPRK